ncbi:MAG: GTPase HflX [bacterium]
MRTEEYISPIETLSKEKRELLPQDKERAIIVGIKTRGIMPWEVTDHLEELELLLDTAGGVVVERILQQRVSPDPTTLIGLGKVRELEHKVKELGVGLVVFDWDLTPAQLRNLERMLGCKVIDRKALILDIFARRARTREARIQVELAQLLYLLPRLTRRWVHLSRQYGGIGTRGPGETQLEIDRQVIKRRIALLRRELARVEKSREVRRSRRESLFQIAIIGYTNAGKSTLLNALTRARAFVEDRLFATLDPLVKAYRFPDGSNRRVLFIDTVGFIRKLPVELVASFKSTLEETKRADLLLHVVDLSHPHWELQMERVEEVLTDMGIASKPQILIFNKVDRIKDSAFLEGMERQYPGALFISALRGIRIWEVPIRISQFMDHAMVRKVAVFRPDEADRLADWEQTVQVIGRTFKDGLIWINYLVPVEQTLSPTGGYATG